MSKNELTDVFSQIYGLPAWQVRKGVGSFLTLEFGEPYLRIRAPYLSQSESPAVQTHAARRQVTVAGQRHLWIYMCNWTISTNGIELAHNEASDTAIEKATQYLGGQILLSVTVEPQAAKTVFEI